MFGPYSPSMTIPSWDDDSWREKDTDWRAGCRRLQSWWRSERLGVDPGPHKANNPERLVASMLPLDAPANSNLLSAEAIAASDLRLAEPGGLGMIDPDRLARNLLASQPLCFSLFGHLAHHPHVLVEWLQSLGIAADAVIDVRLEWAPDRKRHFNGGSAFDALVVYMRGPSTGFVGIECKYAENLAEQDITPREPYLAFTRDSGHWRSGAAERLRAKETAQLWLNTLLVQSCVDKSEEGWDEGRAVMLACGDDAVAFDTTVAVRTDLDEPSRWLTWSSYEALIDIAAQDPGLASWASTFRARYLDFTPVAHLLSPDDRRRSGAPRQAPGDQDSIDRFRAGLTQATTMVEQVFGKGSILEQIDQGAPADLVSIDLATLAARLEELAAATRVTQVIAEVAR